MTKPNETRPAEGEGTENGVVEKLTSGLDAEEVKTLADALKDKPEDFVFLGGSGHSTGAWPVPSYDPPDKSDGGHSDEAPPKKGKGENGTIDLGPKLRKDD